MTYTEQEVLDASLEYYNGDALAAKAFTDKYAMRDGGEFHENTPNAMHLRMANEFERIEKKFPNSMEASQFFEVMHQFRYIVPQGSPMFGMGHRYALVSLSNCVVVDSPKDSVQGIMDTGSELANLYKRRAGVGVDISSLRPDGMKTATSAGTTTGAWSFSDFYSYITRMIGQNGRRGALMITLDVQHPDIEKFVTMKYDKTKVTGANVSVMLSDDFMMAVEADDVWNLQWPVRVANPKVVREVKARDLWNLICTAATERAEPGLIFADNYRNNLPAHRYEDFRFLTVNPCSEIGLSAYDSCRLVSINLTNYVTRPFTRDAMFDYALFRDHIKLAVRMMDDIVELEIEYLQRIIDQIDEDFEKVLWGKLRDAAIKGRRIGLGTHGLADMLSRMCKRYDSDAALEFVERVYETLRDTAYAASADLASERGSFPAFDWETEKDCEFIERMPEWLKTKIAEQGRRNISLLTMAPTGTVAIVSQVSSGIEPVFRHSLTRRKKINPTDVTSRVDFTDKSGDKWQHFEVFNHCAKDYIRWSLRNDPERLAEAEEDATPFLAELPDYFVTSDQIDAMRRVQIQGTIQKFIDHGISSTINLPKGTPVETVKSIYEAAWHQGLKGVTVYVDGSRDGVLLSGDEEGEIVEAHAPKRPDVLPCDIHRVTVDGQKWTILVGMLEGKPYEVFGGPSENIEIPRKVTIGTVAKSKSSKANKKGRMSRYDFVVDTDELQYTIKDIAVNFSPSDENYGVMTRMISLSLRHGVPVQFIVEQLGRDVDSTMFSFSKVMARVLKKYISDGTKSGEKCASCGEKLVFQEGCTTCFTCGASKCS